MPNEAAAIVQIMQPYNPGFELLGVLGELENIDKHRALVVVASVSNGVFSEAFVRHHITLPFANHWSEDGAVLMHIPKRFIPPALLEMEVKARGAIHITFEDAIAKGLSAERTLQLLCDGIESGVIPAFKPFLD
jgi:hypothetical protein